MCTAQSLQNISVICTVLFKHGMNPRMNADLPDLFEIAFHFFNFHKNKVHLDDISSFGFTNMADSHGTSVSSGPLSAVVSVLSDIFIRVWK